MPISINSLRFESYNFSESARASIYEARLSGRKTAFLCHSHLDIDLVKGLIRLLDKSGWKVYVDWNDTSMPSTPNSETARKIQKKIVDYDYFLFLATPNSMVSRWCPWEIGYADGKKSNESIFIIPTIDQSNKSYGNEYMQLYRYIDQSDGALATWDPSGKNGVWLKNL